MGGLPKDPEAKKCIRVLEKKHGWTYDDNVGKSAHIVGHLLCGQGCDLKIDGTASNTARWMWQQARKCGHGKNPQERHW